MCILVLPLSFRDIYASAKRLLHLIWMFPHILLFLCKLHDASLRGMLESAMERLGSERGLLAICVCESTANPLDKGQRAPEGAVTRASRRRRRSARNTKSCSNWRECHVVEKIGRSTRGRCAHLYPGNTDTIRSIISPDLNSYFSEYREFFSQTFPLSFRLTVIDISVDKKII